MVYAYNPGPLISPIIDFYLEQGIFDVKLWVIPSSITKDPKVNQQ